MDRNNGNEAVVIEGPSTWNIPKAEAPMGLPVQSEPIEAAPKQVAMPIEKPKAKREKGLKKPAAFSLSHLPQDGLTSLINTFLNGGRKKKHNYFKITNNRLNHVAPAVQGEPEVFTCIAMKVNSCFIGNASILPTVGRTNPYGNIQSNRSETEIQRRLSTVITMIPFTVFAEAKLPIEKLIMIEKAKSETISRRRTEQKYVNRTWKSVSRNETVHYTGAALFSIEKKCFLFDVDRKELQHGIFNAFLVEIAKRAETIQSAYEGLKPIEVVKAEKQGLKVLRQGEFFFIPVSKKEKRKIDSNEDLHGKVDLRVGPNRPNEASKGIVFSKNGKALPSNQAIDEKMQRAGFSWKTIEKLIEQVNTGMFSGEVFVTGTVAHTGREHKDLKLKGWYRVVPNTAVRSFTIRGDVD